MKVVLDVGQFVSAVIVPQGHPAQILTAWREGAFELVTSRPVLEDLRRVLSYPRLRKRHQWTDEEIEFFVDTLVLAATVMTGQLEVDAVLEDQSDNKVVACAMEGGADYIVASDEHLTKLGIPIVAPRRFIEILREGSSG